MTKEKWTAALVQMDSREDESRNLEAAAGKVREAARQGADLVMLPETVDFIGRDMRSHGKTVPGPVTELFRELARENHIYLHCGSITEAAGEEKCRNTSLLFDPRGEIAGRYSKLHMFDVELAGGKMIRESAQIAGGSQVVLSKTELGMLGFGICYDIRFPEIFRIMGKHQAQVILVCANFTDPTGQAHWEPLLRARAIENTCYILACGQCGEKWNYTAYGNSMIVDPWGRIVVRADKKEQILMGEIDMGLADKTRRQIPCLDNIRQDVYELVEKSVKIY